MATYRFDELLQSLKQAVIAASRVLQREHVRDVQRHFEVDKEGVLTPRTLRVRLPSHQTREGETTEAVHQIPLFSLMQPHQLGIDEMTLDFECTLEGLEDRGEAGTRPVVLDLSPRRWSKGVSAKVSITIRRSDAPEGVARINDHLLKTF